MIYEFSKIELVFGLGIIINLHRFKLILIPHSLPLHFLTIIIRRQHNLRII